MVLIIGLLVALSQLVASEWDKSAVEFDKKVAISLQKIQEGERSDRVLGKVVDSLREVTEEIRLANKKNELLGKKQILRQEVRALRLELENRLGVLEERLNKKNELLGKKQTLQQEVLALRSEATE